MKKCLPVLAELDVGEMRQRLLRLTCFYIMFVTIYHKQFAFTHDHVINTRAITWLCLARSVNAFRTCDSARVSRKAHQRIDWNADSHIWSYLVRTCTLTYSLPHSHMDSQKGTRIFVSINWCEVVFSGGMLWTLCFWPILICNYRSTAMYCFMWFS